MSTPGQPTNPDPSSSTGGSQLVIDNKDTQTLSYQGAWNQQEFNATQTGTGSPVQFSWSTDDGVTVSFIFPKAATAVHFYGMPQPFGGLYNICIDCNPSNQRANETVDAASKGSSDNQFVSRLMYSRFFDKPGVHSLILTNARDPKGTPPGNSRITLDKFILITDDSATQSQSATTSPSSTSSSSPSTQSAAANDAKPQKTPVGPIVGGVIGGLVLLAIVGLLLWLWRRKSRRRQSISLDQEVDPVIEPFYVTPAYVTGTNGNGSNTFTSSSYGLSMSQRNESSQSPTNMTGTHGNGSHTFTSSSSGPSISQRYESDAGPVRSQSTRTNPPLYDQVFPTDNSSSGQPVTLPTKAGRHFRPPPQAGTNNS